MAANNGRRRAGRGRRNEQEQDFELNLASVIDCFTVLITYLLVCASFISMGAMDVDVLTTGDSAPGEPPKVSVAIDLNTNRSLFIKLSGALTDTWTLPAKADGTWDFDALAEKLAAVKGQFPELKAALVSAEETIEYKEIVKAIEKTRETLPTVTLGEHPGSSS